MSVNMTLFGVTAPFAAALMDRFGIRPVLTAALLLIVTGSALSVVMTADWQLVLLWGVLVGTGTGAISMGFVATIATRWFDERRGLITGILTAAGATGQLIFLPVVAEVATGHGRRWACLIVAAAALAVIAPVLLIMRNYPQGRAPTAPLGGFRSAFDGLALGARFPAFWLLAGSFAICGMTTNGLIGTHFIPAANDHGRWVRPWQPPEQGGCVTSRATTTWHSNCPRACVWSPRCCASKRENRRSAWPESRFSRTAVFAVFPRQPLASQRCHARYVQQRTGS